MAGKHPHRDQVGQRHRRTDDQSHGGDARCTMQHAGHGQRDVGVETVAALEQRGEGQCRQPDDQFGEQSEQHAAGHRGKGRAEQRQRGAKIETGLDDGVDQQCRKQDEINQFLDAVPEMVAEVHPAPNGGAEQDQGEVGEQQ